MVSSFLPLGLAIAILSLLQFDGVRGLTDPDLPSSLFYPFGPDEGDSEAPVNDDGSTEAVNITLGFPFFNKTYKQLFVNTNGDISFEVPVGSFTPQSFPVAEPMVAPYWCDVDTTRNPGRVFYRESADISLLGRATQDVVFIYSERGLYFFQAKWIFIATWYNVTYFGGSDNTPVNTFQAVLVTDGRYSFAIFNYGPMTWTTGTGSGGDPATGLGGTPAQVGFNAGDSINYFAVPDSRTPDIVRIGEVTNTGQRGRWMFRIDAETIDVGGCFIEGRCEPYQNLDETSQVCYDIAPDFGCPSLEGPTVIDRLWIEFYCVIPTNSTDPTARFKVTFLFDGVQAPGVPQFNITASQGKATLHEKYLFGQMGRWISCSVSSFWDTGSSSLTYTGVVTSLNSYWAGIQPSRDFLTVYEGSSEPETVLLKSTLPITCMSLHPHTGEPRMCSLSIQLITSADIALRHSEGDCSYTLAESDWKEDEDKAYDDSRPIEVFARKDPFTTHPRLNTLVAKIGHFPQKKEIGETPRDRYDNPWQDYRIPNILVYHTDAPVAVCRASGDPNLATFDRLYYPIYASGQFTYVQTTRGLPVQVQVRHWPCGQVVSCVCAVAIREGDLIMAADMCTDGVMHYLINKETLPIGALFEVFSGGNGFQITSLTGIKVVGYLRGWGMNIEIYVTGSELRRVEGLCGSFDGDSSNDLKVKDTNEIVSIPPTSSSLSRVVASWSVPQGLSIFDGYISYLPVGPESPGDLSGICSCSESGSLCGTYVINGASNLSSTYLVGQTNMLAINPRVPRSWISNGIGTRKKRSTDSEPSTDNIDYEYGTQPFPYTFGTNDSLADFSWPTANNITEEQATEYCRNVLWESSPLREFCSNAVSPSDVEGTINKCVSDIKVTGDLSWSNDKIPEIQNLCLFDTVATNTTDTNQTIGDVLTAAQQVLAATCLPQDCSGQGTCVNGHCVCNADYVGVGCQLARNSVPYTIRIQGPLSCDVRLLSCLSVRMVTSNVTSLPTPICKVDVIKVDYTRQSYLTSASVESPSVTVCALPLDALSSFSNQLNSSSASSFDELPQESPRLYYEVSVSNDGQLFSNAKTLAVFDSVCYDCQNVSCTQKSGACLIKGYCFSNGDRNPYNPDCQECDSATNNGTWKTLPGDYCNPCQSSPCSSKETCESTAPGQYKCIEYVNKAIVIVIACVSVIGSVVLTIAVVLIIKYLCFPRTNKVAEFGK